MLPAILPPALRARGVTAVLGPTNTGKTHLAIERMLGHGAGIIGLPLRLLAREVYNKIVERVGAEHVALVTGEEKIKPDKARYWVATAEAMPRDLDVPFVAIDEIQIAADLERGHVFTDRLLNRRGSHETLLLGAATMRPIVEKLIPGVNVVSRPRLSNLFFAGEKKLTRLPRRSAIVAFSAEEVYAIAELIRRQRGGAAVVLGALSPRTRNAQVAMYQNGDVDYLVATDAIGMGLNLDVDHVAFAGDRKYDGYQFRRLNPSEMGQIAGRAGRHVRDGSFGTTGRCAPFEPDLIEAVTEHNFDSVKVLQWRNSSLDFSSFRALQDSLGRVPDEIGLTRAPEAEDIRVLAIVGRDEGVKASAKGEMNVERLWNVSQVPDYRKISPNSHAELVTSLYGFLTRDGTLPEDWFARQVALSDRTDGDIDTLSTRIAHIRTWTYAANRPDWLKDPAHWQGVTHGVEDKLSDALHERLAQRFVDRRTSVLMRRLRENTMLESEVTKTGDVIVEGQHVGTLRGFQFAPDPSAGDGEGGRALRAAAAKALAGEIEARAQKFSRAPDTEFALAVDGTVRWIGEPVAKLASSEKVLAPRVRVLADEQLTGANLEAVQTRLDIWIGNHVTRLLGPLMALEKAEDVQGLARGVAFQLVEALGVLDRSKVSDDLKSLDQEQRSTLRKHGVRFGAYHLYLPALMKPAPRALATQLWALGHGGTEQKGLDEIPHLAASGRTSIAADPTIDKALYRLGGYRVCGERAVRVDILERLADLIRPAIAYRPGTTIGEPPAGTADGDGFVVTVQMTSLVGCSGEDFASILKSLGYRMEMRKGAAITQPILRPAPMVPVVVKPVEEGAAEAAPEVEAADTPAAAADEAAAADGGAAEEAVVPFAESVEPAEHPAEVAADVVQHGTQIAEANEVVVETSQLAASAADDVIEAADAPAEAVPEAAADEPVVQADAPVVEADVPAAASADEIVAASETEPPIEAASEAPESIAEAAPAVAAEPVPEPEIAVWRPVRFERHARPQPSRNAAPRPPRTDGAQQQPHHRRGRPQGAAPAPAEGVSPMDASAAPRRSEGDAPRRDDRPRRFDRDRSPDNARDNNSRDHNARPDRKPREAGAPATRDGNSRPEGSRPEGGRPDHARNGDNRGGGRPQRGRDDRGPRHGGDEGRGDRTRSWSTEERPARREDRAPDPNSPFAKLLALKEQMQGKKSDKTP